MDYWVGGFRAISGHMKFFFNVAGAVHDPDQEGHELESMSEARLMAATFAAEMLHDRPELAWLGDEFRVEVTNSKHDLLFTIITLGVDSTEGQASIKRMVRHQARMSPLALC